MLISLSISSDNVIRITGLADAKAATTTYVNDAAVNVTLKDTLGNVITGPLTLSYVAASNAQYDGILDHSVVLSRFTAYYAEITAVSPTAGTGFWRVPSEAIYDDGS